MAQSPVSVVAVEIFEASQPVEVFDIQVEEDASFIVAGVVVHNSEICAARDGEVYPLDSGPRPPAHPNCLPGDALVTSRYRITGASKRWYDGELVVIRTAGGKHLSCTPNHPILTDRGWVAARLLDVGHNVVCDGGAEWSGSALDVNHENVPTAIEEVAEAAFRALEMQTRPVPTTAEHFHGDGMDGEVAIVASDCFLADGDEPALEQQGGQSAFIGGNAGLPLLSGPRDLDAVFIRLARTAHRVMGGLREFCARGWGGVVHAGLLLFGPVARLQALSFEGADDRVGRAPEMLRDARDTDAARVHLCDLGGRQDDARVKRAGSQRLPGLVQAPNDGVRADAQLARDILSSATGSVFLDQVVDVERRDFRGHVFNLETEKGFYVSSGIVTHNCRSTTVPVLKSWKEMGINLREAPEGTRASMNGQVPASTTYGEWLRRQPASVQDEALGKTKGALFRRGDLPIDRFVDDRGRAFTLDELRQREASAFERAGLN